MEYNSTESLPPQVQQYFDSQLLAVITPQTIYGYAAERRTLPSQNGDTYRFSRYERLPTAMVPLAGDGSIPSPTSVTRVELDAKVKYYGLYIASNARVVLNNQDAVLNSFAELLGLSLRETEDNLLRDTLMSSAAMYNCTGGVNGDNPTDISGPDIDEVTQILYSNNAWFITQNQEGQDKFGTGPLAESYIAMANSAIMKDLNNLNGFLRKQAYPSPNATLSSEWGAYNNCRFLLSSIGATRPNASLLGNTIYPIAVVGMEAYVAIDQDNYSSRFIYLDPRFSDPLLQSFTVGYTMAHGSRILNDQWVMLMNATTR